MDNLDQKTKDVIIYVSQKHPRASITAFMKICYLIDLISFRKTKQQITQFSYMRYNYGPFDDKMYSYIQNLLEEKILNSESEYTPNGQEYFVYSFNDSADNNPTLVLSADETNIADEVLNAVVGFGAKTLTEIAYKTKPMVALGATLGGKENFSQLLDLSLQ